MTEFDPLSLAAKTEARDESRFKGQWFTVRWLPDIFTGEVLNIGVGYIDGTSRQITARLLEDPARVKCLYPGASQLIDDFQFLTKTVLKTLEQNEISSPSPNVNFSSPQWTQGDSPETIVDKLYRELVTLDPGEIVAQFDGESPQSRVVSTVAATKTDVLVNKIYKGIRSRIELRAEDIIPQYPFLRIPAVDQEPREIYLPLIGKDHIGTIVSNAFITVGTCESKILRAHLDLETAKAVRSERNLGMFVRKAVIPLTDKKYEEKSNGLEALYDEFEFHMEKQGITFKTDTHEEELVEKIVDWAGIPQI